MYEKMAKETRESLADKIKVARGEVKADLVIKGASFLDVFSGKFLDGDIALHQGYIVGILDSYEGEHIVEADDCFVVPGFIDSHVHIESSLMTPARFQQSVLPLGTTTAIWDPHEIANVWGKEGINWALEASEGLDLDFFLMLPSCVPATSQHMGLETSGAHLTTQDLIPFKNHPRVLGLAEMMNYPGLLFGDNEVHEKLIEFKAMKRDGHCPGLSGKDLNAYGVAGIHSCHESTTLQEANEKLAKGIRVLIREGSCAKDAETLLPLINAYNSCALGLCSDDRNPKDISQEGHISFIINLALKNGARPEDIFRVASFAAAQGFGLNDRGAIAPGYLGDICLIKRNSDSWQDGFRVHTVYKNGRKVDSQLLMKEADARVFKKEKKNLALSGVKANDFLISVENSNPVKVNVIGVREGQILTDALNETLKVMNGAICANLDSDVLKIAVLERHTNASSTGLGFVKGFGLKTGAIATSINHDSHNVIVVGASDELMAAAVNRLIEIDGGIVVYHESKRYEELALPIGGLMTDLDPAAVTDALIKLKRLAVESGCVLDEPFLQLSFLALPVIPSLKITDRGLVDVNEFKLIDIIAG